MFPMATATSRRSIRLKLTTLIVLLVAISVGAVTTGGLWGARRYLGREARLTLVHELNHVDEQVRSVFAGLQADGYALRAFLQRSDARVARDLGAFASARPPYSAAFVLGSGGEVLAGVDRRGRRPRGSLYYVEVAGNLSRGEVAVLPVELPGDDTTELVRPSLAVVARLAAPTVPRAATLVLELHADTLLEVFRQASDPLGGTLGVVAADGHVLFQSGRRSEAGQLLVPTGSSGLAPHLDSSESDAVLSGGPGEFESSDRIVVFRPVGPLPAYPDEQLVAYRVVTRRELMAPVRRLEWSLLVGLIVLLAAAVVLASVAARRVTQPVIQLRDATRAVARGELIAPHVARTNDELEDLAEAFAAMVHEVRSRREDLEAKAEALRAIAAGTASATGADFFPLLVRHLASALQVRWAYIAEIVDAARGQVRTLAVWDGTDPGENFEYDLADTPCARVADQRPCCYPKDVRALFPRDRLLAEMGVESYLGAPLVASTGATLGLLVVLHDQPMQETNTAESVLAIFASRGAVELERTRASEALRRSEEGYRSIVEGAPYGVFRSTKQGRFAAVNAALVRMLGYHREGDLAQLDIGRDVYADPQERERLIRERADQEHFVGVEARWKRRDGTPLVVSVNGRVIRNGEGEVTGYEGFVEDVTERRSLEEQLRQSQRLESIGRLAGGIAHDFNNLLTTVLATCDLMAREAPDNSPILEDLRAIREAAERGAELTRKMLAFGRRQRLAFRAVNLAEHAVDFVRIVRRMVPENMEIVLRQDCEEPVSNVDPGAIDQVLMNLVTNARDAMPDGGKLEIHVGRVLLDEQFSHSHGFGAPGRYVTLTITDSGAGMDEETRRRIFEPFFTTKPVGAGTGLGMAIVYGLVQQHNGFVHVLSEVGEGTAVRVYLPESELSPVPRPPAAVAALARGTETLLLVEDEESLRRTTRRVLEMAGYRVLVASDGMEALEVFGTHRDEIKLVISDVVMPRLGGPQLLDELRRRGPAPRILFTSGYTARDVQLSRALDPSLPFLSKPWAVTDLLRQVREVLDS